MVSRGFVNDHDDFESFSRAGNVSGRAWPDKLYILVDALLHVLDDDIHHVREGVEDLKKMRESVIKRDEKSLAALIEKMRISAEDYQLIEQKRLDLREQIGLLLDCEPGQVNLSRLCSLLSGSRQIELKKRQKELHKAVPQMQREHEMTAALLRECTRFNRILLKALVGTDNTSGTYDQKGASRLETQKGILSYRV